MLGRSSFNISSNQAILLIVGRIARVFCIIPMIRRWAYRATGIGIGGTSAFMILWVITRLPANPIREDWSCGQSHSHYN
ncbi:MAG: hypothetical protein ACJ70X_03030 [Nitrososphaera sp.]